MPVHSRKRKKEADTSNEELFASPLAEELFKSPSRLRRKHFENLYQSKNTSESSPRAVFRKEIIFRFEAFAEEARGLAEGYTAFSTSQNERFTAVTFSILLAFMNAGIALLGVYGVLVGITAVIIALSVTLFSIAVCTVYNMYRNRVQKREFEKAAAFVHQGSVKANAEGLSDALVNLYDKKLDTLSNDEEARRLAGLIASALFRAVIKQQLAKISDLFDLSLLRKILTKAGLIPPNQRFNTVEMLKNSYGIITVTKDSDALPTPTTDTPITAQPTYSPANNVDVSVASSKASLKRSTH